jgi:ubiquinone/menaquinone biosynthesis C-methylase UbiE
MYCLHLLRCPVCHTAMEREGTILRCAHSHTFDIAKEGYVNLLRKKLAGDTKEMVQARRSFLERGFYQPLADMLNTLIQVYLHEQTLSINVLDAGCGEGYYLGRLQQSLPQQSCLLGFDVAKDAVRMAAKRYPSSSFVVANLKEQLVLADECIHILLNIFAPRNPAEFARVMVQAGRLIVVIPGVEHMAQLRSALPLLQIEENKQQHVVEQFAPYFTLRDVVPVSYELDLRGEEVQQLVMMTPNYWHLSDEARMAMNAIQALRTQIAFICLVFEKNAG